MKAISFLGTTDYEEATYVYKEQECKTHLFPYAVAHFFEPTALLVCLTPEATRFVPKKKDPVNTKTHFQTLCNLHEQEGLVTPTAVSIPRGANEGELWDIFQILTSILDDTDEVIFDITHAFRSLPLLAFLAAAYLRVAKQIRLRTIVYGAFEAKQQDGKVPVFDLTPFLSLLEWTAATDQFLKTGNAQTLAIMLSSSGAQMQKLAENINGIAQGLHLLRPLDVMQSAAVLSTHITAAERAITHSVPPFNTLLKRVKDDYGKFGLQDPAQYKNDRESLKQQLEIAGWYAEKQQIVHALSMAREWLPSLICYRFRLDPLNKTNRDKMEELLNGTSPVTVRRQLYHWPEVPHGAKIRHLWQQIASLRNDVLHAGLRRDRKTAEQILEKTAENMSELQEIASLWNLKD